MKNKLVKSLLLGASLSMTLAVGACSLFGGGKKLEAIKIDPYSLTGANYRNLRINGTGYSGEQFTEHEEYTEETGYRTRYVIENVKALVVPVDFTDYPSSLFGTEDNSREMLRRVMFGSGDDTNWYSLKEYYASSSFGQCNIEGSVAPWWHTNIASESIDKTDTSYATRLAVQIQDYYREHNDPENGGINLAEYDANKDGLLDSLIMVYTAPITTTGQVWWAFCSSVSGAYGRYTKDGSKIGANRYFWASIKFLFEKQGGYYSDEEIANGTAIPDAHTMTHEYGHVLSLPDYYDTDYTGSKPYGALDMMDYNIGDHNAFSKMLYGWINPTRIEGSSGSITLELNSTTTTGDAIIIPAVDGWHDTYLDQYLVVEFLTPEGVAKKDSEAKYLGTYPLYYSIPGVRISHVDARMGVWNYNNGNISFGGFTYTSTRGDDYYVDFACDNTSSRSGYKDYKLLELLPHEGKMHGVASDKSLYTEGDYFGSHGVFNGYKFNGTDGTQKKAFGFKIHVDKIVGNEKAIITISR